MANQQAISASLDSFRSTRVLEDRAPCEGSQGYSNQELTRSRQQPSRERLPPKEEQRLREDAEEESRRDSYSTSSLSRPDTSNAAPIGKKLDAFRNGFGEACQNLDLPVKLVSLDSFGVEDTQNLLLDLISALRALPDMRKLPSANGRKNLLGDLLRLNVLISSGDFEVEQFKSLLNTVLDNQPDNIVWDQLYTTVRESTPPPLALPVLDQTPFLHTTSSLVNSSEHRSNFDGILKEELGPIYIGVPGFHDAFFGQIKGLQDIAAAVYAKCKAGPTPLFEEGNGWKHWPINAKEKDVLDWLSRQVHLLHDLAVEVGFPEVTTRAILAQPNQTLRGSKADRKLDIGFVRRMDANTNYSWSDVMVLGELKSNAKADTSSRTWHDLGRYAREVLTAQDTRLFALGFSLCGSIMRLWEFDRAGVIASSQFDINQDGQQFVLSMLGFLHMNHTQLGFDPTILTSSDGRRYIQIVRDGQSERLVIDKLVRRAQCVAGRATTCWKAHREGDEANIPLVIKDSWQYPERDEEGELLREAAARGVINVARYYYHETIQVDGRIDDIRDNIRRGLDVKTAANYRLAHSERSPAASTADTVRTGRLTNTVGRKRSSSRAGAGQPPSKRTCSSSPSKYAKDIDMPNRVHRRVVVRDYGTAIYKASSPISIVSALESCIEGYRSLHMEAGLLHGDISTGNLILNDEKGNPSWPAFLIDLDLAIREQREGPSGARAKTGTRAFMAIGLLLGERHSFMHDLESFFWVVLWICIHYDGPNGTRVVPRFEKWNYADMEELAGMKLGVVAKESIFLKIATDNFTPHYETLIPWVNRLRKEVFPLDKPWEKEDLRLYERFQTVLSQARKDPSIQ
ncbi:hypothetical protein BP00DRAFT_218463 [Aspergillus indologenus CBS 114.80]|uniref:non-specific serine/threonine protein kinase n=1 Tax=Aspergillus indologenus CBS 114.80 TaxID=1450541 RepID=A0A2V5INS2_9EURO|nr:hypothetical protein BP00DRAFT_218463 [Aspergillus indologenus CBS 114.80]